MSMTEGIIIQLSNIEKLSTLYWILFSELSWPNFSAEKILLSSWVVSYTLYFSWDPIGLQKFFESQLSIEENNPKFSEEVILCYNLPLK